MMRGLQKSDTLEQNLIEAQNLADQGVRELLVIAQDTTTYGWDLNPKSSLHELMDVLNSVQGLDWIRLHYAHPAHLNKKMIERYPTSIIESYMTTLIHMDILITLKHLHLSRKKNLEILEQKHLRSILK